tara:strand:- start:1425 stop:2246 length:822 start_codon:yes stop_codon:yes gene_type:complete
VIKKTIVLLSLAISFLSGQNMIKVKLKNGKTVDGEFIGTYMEHIHLLIGENINHFKCEDIQSVTKNHIYSFDYDCSKNTVTADILFSPQINPMTGEWETIIPDIFDPEKRELLAKQEKRASEDKKPQENSRKEINLNVDKVLKEQLEKTKNNFQKVINTKVKPAISNAFYEDGKEKPYQNKTQTKKKALSSSSITNDVSIPQKGLTTYYYEDGAMGFSEDEIRRFIKKEVRKELRKTLPYEIRKHKEQSQNKLFQTIFLGCGAWFVFMILLSF